MNSILGGGLYWLTPHGSHGIREDYPEDAYWTDEQLHEHYADRRKYAITWDHIGDAYDEYEPLADAFLTLLENK